MPFFFVVPFDPHVYQFLVCEVKKSELKENSKATGDIFNYCLKLWQEIKNPIVGEELIDLAYKTGNKKALREIAKFYKERNPKLYHLASFYLSLLENNEEKAFLFGKTLIREGYLNKQLINFMFGRLLEKEDLETLLLIAEYLYRQNPENDNVRKLLKNLYLTLLIKNKNQPKKEEELLQRALKLFPRDKQILEIGLDYYLGAGKTKEAENIAKKLGWNNKTYELERLKVLFSLNKLGDFEKLLKHLVEEYPTDENILRLAIRYYTLWGSNADELIEVMEKYLKLNPEPQTVPPKAVLIYFLTKMWKGTLTKTDRKFLQKYIKTYAEEGSNGVEKADVEEYIVANILKASLYIKNGEYKKGLAILKKLKPLAGERLNRLMLYPAYKVGDKETYRRILKELEPKLIFVIADFFKDKDKEFVRSLLKDYVRFGKNDAAGYEFAAWALDRLGFWSDAERLLREAIKRFPEHAEFYNYLGYSYVLYFGKKRIKEALELLQKAHRLKPEDAPILDSLGWAYFIEGDWKKARLYLEEALKKMPEDPVITSITVCFF